jgi:ATP-dependent DNA helicase RecG
LDLREIGVLPAKIKQFNKKGIFTVEDLIEFYPRKYYDFTKETGLLTEEDISSFIMKVTDVKAYENRIPMFIASGYELSTHRFVKVMWFRQQYLYPNIAKLIDCDVFVCGKATYNDQYKTFSISSPLVFSANIEKAKRVYPVYSAIQGMSDDYLQKHVQLALNEKHLLMENIPKHIVENEQLMERELSIKELHNPTSTKKLHDAEKRLEFENLLYFAGRLEWQHRQTPKGNAHNIISMKLFNDVKSSLPFTLSEGQQTVIQDIMSDMKEGKNVRALLSSDVGSGKTVVAMLLSCLFACKTSNFNGYQVAWLVPSKALAMQHVEELRGYLEPLGYEVLFLNSQMKKREKEEALKKIKSGEVNFIVGTHSILNDAVEFNDLALIVCDESHRFGVVARNKLSHKVSGKSHILTMSGTPIPRTLALLVTNNGQKLYTMARPSGRLPIKTCISNNRNAIFKFIKQEVNEGHQVYVVCPMISKTESENPTMENVVSVEEISDIYNKELQSLGIKIETLTGKNKAEETSEIIEHFKSGETNVLIATSVIEVGINIPNATTIVIENAERFGIASLHQLRGRVGRKANSQGYCVLRSDDVNNERLKALVEIQDGFKLSEIDLSLRKSGDLIGEAQSGENKFVELMLANRELFTHISEDIVPQAMDDGSIEEFITNRYIKETGKDVSE